MDKWCNIDAFLFAVQVFKKRLFIVYLQLYIIGTIIPIKNS